MNRTHADHLPLIALVDPDLVGSQSLEAALAGRFQFLIEANSEAALRTANGASVWLWVIAAHLPDSSGAEFCRLLRSRDPAARVVVIGAGAAGEDEIACRTAGSSHFFCRPLDPRLFTLFVDDLARGDQRASRRAAAPYGSPAGADRRSQSLLTGHFLLGERL